VHVDVGVRADLEKPNLFSVDGATVQEVTPNVGTEIHGIQLSQLSPEQLDELALLAAERGVLIFKGQDFADIGPEKQKQYGAHFGHLHVHQMGTHIKDFPDILPVYRDAE
jgi:sulfonate dioxygenase